MRGKFKKMKIINETVRVFDDKIISNIDEFALKYPGIKETEEWEKHKQFLQKLLESTNERILQGKITTMHTGKLGEMLKTYIQDVTENIYNLPIDFSYKGWTFEDTYLRLSPPKREFIKKFVDFIDKETNASSTGKHIWLGGIGGASTRGNWSFKSAWMTKEEAKSYYDEWVSPYGLFDIFISKDRLQRFKKFLQEHPDIDPELISNAQQILHEVAHIIGKDKEVEANDWSIDKVIKFFGQIGELPHKGTV